MATTEIDREQQVQRNWPLAIGAGLLTAALGTALWFAAHEAGGRPLVWLAVPVGAGIGLAVSRGARGRGPAAVAVLLTLLTMIASQNFAQRAALQRGIEDLQQRWDALSAAATTPAGAAEPSGVVPPPEIVAILPVGGLLQMTPEVMAQVWDHIPEQRRAELPEDRVAAVEQILAGEAPASAPESGEATTPAADAELDDHGAGIPRAVLECAPPPDFTQPNAAAGLGFPDGVPLLLPAADLFGEDRVRGDGEEYEPADPRCFAREHLKERPDEGAAWILGAVAAAAVAGRRSSPDGRGPHPKVRA